MLNSLRVRLVVLSVCLTAISLALCSYVIYLIVKRELTAHVDDTLVSQGTTFAALIEYNTDDGSYEFNGQQVLAAEGNQLRFSATTLAGQTLAASSGIIREDPNFSLTNLLRPHAWSWLDIDREPWRAVICTAPSTREHESTSGVAPDLLIRIARPSTELENRLHHITQLLALVTVGLSLLMGIVIGLSIGRALRPLNQLTATLARWSGDQVCDRLPVPQHPAELIPVITTLNDFLARMEASLQRERATGSAIAHEIRTPLAGLRVVIEVALSRQREAEAHRASLNDCFAMVNHVQRMVESLLLLSRCEQGRVPLQLTNIDFGTCLKAAWGPLCGRTVARGLTLSWVDGPTCTLSTDHRFLTMVLHNVLDNAVAHADAHGQIEVRWKSIPSALELTISNTCTTLIKTDLERIFVRFWRSDQARTIDDQHCGLGLCLALDITRSLGGQLTPKLEEECFSMTLKLPLSAPSYETPADSPSSHVPLITSTTPDNPRHLESP